MPSKRISRRRFVKETGQFAAAGMMGSLVALPWLRAADLPRPGAADWPRYGYDSHNTRFNSKESTIGPDNVARLKMKWKFDTLDNFPIQITPAVIGDTLFFGAGGYYYSLDSITGKLKWSFAVGDKDWINSNKNKNQAVRSSCEYVDGRIYFGTGFNNVHCLDANTGKEIWKTTLAKDGQTEFSPVVYKGKVFMGYSGPAPELFCLDAETGAIRWRWRVNQDVPEKSGGGGGSLWTSSAIDEQQNVVFTATGNNNAYSPAASMLYTNSLVSHDADTGELLWAYQDHPQDAHDLDFCAHPMVFDAVSPPRLRGDIRHCVAAGNKVNMVCLNRHSGELFWRVSLNAFAAGTGGPKVNATAVAYNNVYIQTFAPTVMPIFMDDAEWKQKENESVLAVTAALDAYNGEIRWMVPNLGRNSSPLAVANGVLYQGIQKPAKIEALNAKTGERLWEAPMPSPYRGGASIANGAVYTSNGELLSGLLTRGSYPYSVYCFTIDGK
jgi:outer membrane protein assembly factor BamB